ncbi:MAG: DUF1326 domain-containing protein [Limisphaerales bacterium]
MKTSALLLCALATALAQSVLASPAPRGTLIELHSCELYAGGCIVSSESTLGGRYMLRAWDFSGGEFAGTDLTGLQVAVLQSANDNLAEHEAMPGNAVVYLPQTATAAQRAALVGWIKKIEPQLGAANLQTRTTHLRFRRTQVGYDFSAGPYVTVSTAPLETCKTGACGEALWYSPRSPSSVFTVAIDRVSEVTEPLLELKWRDAGRRTVFLARFGDKPSQTEVYISSADFCGPAQRLF